MLKAIRRLQEELDGDVKVGKNTEARLKTERKTIVKRGRKRTVQ